MAVWQAFPPLPWNGKLTSGLRELKDEDSQRECYYPSCDTSLPTYIPAMEGDYRVN